MVKKPDVESQWREASSGGQTFRYVDSGAGPLVVLFHGFPDLPTSWDSIRERLNAAGYRTVAPYLRGYHPATLSDRRFTADDLADDVVLLLDALGEPAATVVGHDWGSALAYGAAHKYPDRTTKVVAIGIPHLYALKPDLGALWKFRHFADFKMPWAALTARFFDFRLVDRLVRRWSPSWDGAERDATVNDAVEALRDQRVLRGALAYYRAVTPLPRLHRSQITVPGLIVGGTEDPRVLQRGYAATPSRFAAPCEVRILEGAGHWPHRENEDAFIDALLSFLKS